MEMKSKYLRTLIPAFATLLACVYSCSKDSGFYNAGVEDKTFNGNTYEYLKSKPGVFDSLIKVIDRMGYQNILENDKVTLFAVPNQSFQVALTNLNNLRKKSELNPLAISSVEAVHLDTMMSQYIIKGNYTTELLDFQDGVNLFGVKYNYPMNARLGTSSSSGYISGGADNIVFQNTNRSALVRNWVSTTTTSNNIKTKNGIVHVVSSDHIFGFRQFVSRFTYVPPPPNLFVKVGGKITVSSCARSACNPNNIEGYNRVIDRDRNTKFLEDPFRGGWLKFEFNSPVIAGSYTLVSANDAEDRDPASWSLDGSNDNRVWTTLDTRNEEVFRERFMERVFYFNNRTPYRYYRITFNSMRFGGSAFQLAEWSINEPSK